MIETKERSGEQMDIVTLLPELGVWLIFSFVPKTPTAPACLSLERDLTPLSSAGALLQQPPCSFHGIPSLDRAREFCSLG